MFPDLFAFVLDVFKQMYCQLGPNYCSGHIVTQKKLYIMEQATKPDQIN